MEPVKRVMPPIPLTQAQEAATSELRKGLWVCVDRWLSARMKLPGDGTDKFKADLRRLCQNIVFDEWRVASHEELDCFDAQLGAELDRGCMRRETTSTTFHFRTPANHPRPPPKMHFTADTWLLSADAVHGRTQNGVKDLWWRTEMEISGVLALSFDTQSFHVQESIQAGVLEQLKVSLTTDLTPAELGVLLLITGMCCRGAAAWSELQDVCFWSHNFTLPELQSSQR